MIKIVNQIKELTIKKENIEKVIHDIESRYFDSGIIRFDIETSEYNSKLDGNEHITFDKYLMKQYLINELDSTISELINKNEEIGTLLNNNLKIEGRLL